MRDNLVHQSYAKAFSILGLPIYCLCPNTCVQPDIYLSHKKILEALKLNTGNYDEK